MTATTANLTAYAIALHYILLRVESFTYVPAYVEHRAYEAAVGSTNRLQSAVVLDRLGWRGELSHPIAWFSSPPSRTPALTKRFLTIGVLTST